jgi:hypothetical protein
MRPKETKTTESALLDEAARHLAGNNVMAYWRAGWPLRKLEVLLGGGWRVHVSEQLSLRGLKRCSINRLSKALTFRKIWDERDIEAISNAGLPVREAVRLAFYETVGIKAGKAPRKVRATLLANYRSACRLKGEARDIALKKWRTGLSKKKRSVMSSQPNTQRKALAEARGAVEHRLEAVGTILDNAKPATSVLVKRVSAHRQVLDDLLASITATFDSAIKALKS